MSVMDELGPQMKNLEPQTQFKQCSTLVTSYFLPI
jgi:hypothetical protein